MNSLTASEILAGLNIIVMVCVSIVFVLRTGDMMKSNKETLTRVEKIVTLLDKRVTVIETICAMNHPQSAKELLTVQE